MRNKEELIAVGTEAVNDGLSAEDIARELEQLEKDWGVKLGVVKAEADTLRVELIAVPKDPWALAGLVGGLVELAPDTYTIGAAGYVHDLKKTGEFSLWWD